MEDFPIISLLYLIPGWVYWALALGAIIGLKKLIPWVKKHARTSEESMLLDIEEWKTKHLVQRVFNKHRTLCYLSDAGNVFQLGVYKERITKISSSAEQTVKGFRERRQSRKKLARDLRKDSLLDQIERAFLTAIGQYYNGLHMFQYERLDEPEYAETAFAQMEQNLANAQEFNRHYSDYMLALTQSATMNLDSERELIAQAVLGLETAVADIQGDAFAIPSQIPMPAPLPLPANAEPLSTEEDGQQMGRMEQ